jgi:hypothetical protein
MKNKLIILVGLVVGCETPGSRDPVSPWADLSRAQSSDCRPWPVSPTDLETQLILPAINEQKILGFVAETKTRSGSLKHDYFIADGLLKFREDNSQTIPIGNRTSILAHFGLSGQPVILTSVVSSGRSTLEARAVGDNRLLGRSGFVLDEEVRDAEVVVDGEYVFLTLRTGDYSTVFARYSVSHKGVGQFEKASFATSSRGATLVVERSRRKILLVEGKHASDMATFKISFIRPKDFTISGSQSIEVKAPGGVESWSVSNGSGGVSLAIIAGDSMVGQAQLIVGRLTVGEDNVNWLWTDSINLPDIHVSEPVWSSDSSGDVLTLVKWMDAEATIAIYDEVNSKLVARSDYGVHPKGSVVLKAFSLTGQEVGLILRNKTNDVWVHSVCRVKR